MEPAAIISEELFDKAQLQLQGNREEAGRMYQPNSRRYLLRRRVRCGLCQLAMECHCSKIRGEEYLYYRCRGNKALDSGRSSSCQASAVNAKQLDELVWQALVNLVNEPSMIMTLQQQYRSSSSCDGQQLEEEITRLARSSLINSI